MTLRLFLAAAAIAIAAPVYAQQPEVPGGVVGHWTDGYRVFAFMPGGHGAVAESGAPFTIVTYETKGNQLRFADIDGFTPCTGMSALYEFEIDGDAMIVTPIDDPCPVRNTDGQPLTLNRMLMRPAGNAGGDGGDTD